MRNSGLGLLLVVLAAGCSEPGEVVLPEVPVVVEQVAPRDVAVHSEYVGELIPAQEVALRARTGGILLEQHVPDGARVAEGQLLFTIDAREATERRAAARAELAAARAQLAGAEADVARYAPLVPEEAIARQVFDNAVAARDAARAVVDAQTAVLRQAELGVEYAEIRSPLDGRMGAARVAVGDLIRAGDTVLAEVAVDDPLWVYIGLSETELLDLEARLRGRPDVAERIGRGVSLELADGRPYPLAGRIDFRDRALDPVTGTYRVRAVFENPEGRLLPGQFTRVRLLTDWYEGALVVSARAITSVLDQDFVTVLAEDRTVEQRPVRLGQRLDGAWTVDEGLTAGETIVLDGAQKLRPGMRARPQPATDDA